VKPATVKSADALSGKWLNVSAHGEYIDFIDDDHWETDRFSGTYRVDGSKVTFSNAMGMLQRGEFEGNALRVEKREPSVVRSGDYVKEGAPLPDPWAQRETVRSIRNLGAALTAWLSDQNGSRGRPISWEFGSSSEPPAIDASTLTSILVPRYIEAVPTNDGWGHKLDIRLNPASAASGMGIRSPGRDGVWDQTPYSVGGFPPEEWDRDVVWSNDYFVRWPQRD